MGVDNSLKYWNRFYDFFPETELPVTLTDDSIKLYSSGNRALPGELIGTYLLDQAFYFADKEQDPLEDIEEFVACFRLPQNKAFHAIVFWKAGLMKYEYILQTFDLKGKPISRQVIASTSSDGKSIRHIVATITPGLEVYIMGGDSSINDLYDASRSIEVILEISETGHIMHQLNES